MSRSVEIACPISSESFSGLHAGTMVSLSGKIIAGRDAALPRLVQMIESGVADSLGFSLQGAVVFHTAVSPAGVGPTSSNKLDIERSIPILSKVGVKMHLGKGSLSQSTIIALERHESSFAIIPPVTALLTDRIVSSKVLAFPELGMEALHLIEVREYPAVMYAVNGEVLN